MSQGPTMIPPFNRPLKVKGPGTVGVFSCNLLSLTVKIRWVHERCQCPWEGQHAPHRRAALRQGPWIPKGSCVVLQTLKLGA